jgi:Skp family chaperone for outer membrane proteins
MQDPQVAYTVITAVIDNLKNFMSEYRTSKSRQDVENLMMICEERKQEYYAAQKAYAQYTDSNKNLVQNLQKAEQEKMVEINKKLQDAIAAVGKEGSYICVFDEAGSVPFINKTLCDNVTAKVKTKLGIAANAVPAVAK